MNFRILFAAALLPLQACATPPDPVEPGLQAVAQLGRINGQALACQDPAAARRAKALMLAHAPKTARFGHAFDDATQQAFLAQTGGSPCPDAAALAQRLDAVARQLQATLPAAP